CPNWLGSRNPGAWAVIGVPGSRFGLAAAERSAAVMDWPPPDMDWPPPVPLLWLVPHAASAAAAASATATPAARTSEAGRCVPFPTISHPATRPRWRTG